MMNHPLWVPSSETKAQANLTHFIHWLSEIKGKHFDSYEEVWKWSVTDHRAFWSVLWDYFQIQADGNPDHVLSGAMPQTRWFENTRLSYSEHVFRSGRNHETAIIAISENNQIQHISYQELRDQVSKVQRFLISSNVRPGDRVVAYLPCILEATIAFLAANSIGAIWSSCSPDFGTQSVVDRFAPIEPAILIAADEYSYGGKSFSKKETILALQQQLSTVKQTIIIGETDLPHSTSWKSILAQPPAPLTFYRSGFNDPIWILFSSGTTGLPKAITQSVGGILLEHLKYLSFHQDVKPLERCFWYTTTGWMMWNYIQSTLLLGATVILFDGSPAYPDLNRLWRLAEEQEWNHFGTSAGFILACMKAGINPKSMGSLKKLRSIGSTGSTLPPEGFAWIYEKVKPDVWLTSMSGGTDICSAFVGGNPLLPVYAGEIQCRALGVGLEAWNETGQSVIHQVGEMVITHPMPSMPVFFWNDPDFKRYRESYFEVFPGVWRHGDWIEVTEHHGIIIYGRSDATLNRGGVRIGTSEIYRAVDKVAEVKDSMIICLEKAQGEFYMPLFVVMQDSKVLTDEIRKKINQTLRLDYSPRHVPDEIIQVPDIPYTISGKKTETPVKKILMGQPVQRVVNPGSLRNPSAMDFFTDLYQKSVKK
jgi:acetoacetyl-CoA synthetase